MGKTLNRRILSVADGALELTELKSKLGMKNTVTRVTDTTEVYRKRHPAQIIFRKVGRSGPTITSVQAQALTGCKGKAGGDFVTCVKTALGKAPANMIVTGGTKSAQKKAAAKFRITT